MFDPDTGLQLKCEADFYDRQYWARQQGKAGIGPPYLHHGHYDDYAAVDGVGAPGRLQKYDKDPGGQLGPHRGPPSDPLSSSQSVNLMDRHAYPGAHMEPHKTFMQQDYGKHNGYEFKGHGIIHSIKREPVDSPPWSEESRDVGQALMGGPRSALPCAIDTGTHRTNPYGYMQ